MIMKNCLFQFIITIFLGIALLLLPSTAHAFPYKGYDIDISAMLSQTYDNNANFSEDNVTDNYSVRGSVELGVNYAGKRRSLHFNGGITRDIYKTAKGVNGGSESFSLKFQHDFSQYMYINITDSYFHTKEPLDFYEELRRITGRFDFHSNTLSVRLQRYVNKNFDVYTSYSNRQVKREESLFEDSETNSVGIGLNYKRGVDKIFYLTFNYGKWDPESSEGSTSYGVSAGVEKYLAKRLSLNGGIGINNNHRDDTGIDYNSYYASVSLNDQINRITSAKLAFSIGKSMNDETEGETSNNWRINGSVSRVLRHNLNGSLGLFYGQYDYSGIAGDDSLFGVKSSINYLFNDHLTSNLGYAYSLLDSTKEDRGYTRNTITAGLKYTF